MDISEIDYTKVLNCTDSTQMAALVKNHAEIWRSQSRIFVQLSPVEADRIAKKNILEWVKNNNPGTNNENLIIVEKLIQQVV